jgi:hypothetical protein
MGLGAEQRPSGPTEALQELAAFPLVEALYGRRSRRFALVMRFPTDRLPTAPGRGVLPAALP